VLSNTRFILGTKAATLGIILWASAFAAAADRTTEGIAAAPSGTTEPHLWAHLRTRAAQWEEHGLNAEWIATDGDSPAVRLTVTTREFSSWLIVPAPEGGWPLDTRSTVEVDVHNPGTKPVNVMMWVVASRGWDAVPDIQESIQPGETRHLKCHLREGWRDYFGAKTTPKIDPHLVTQIQIVLWKTQEGDRVELSNLVAKGREPEFRKPADRLEVPDMEEGVPAPGRRVRFRLEGEQDEEPYSVLYLPADWKAGGRYPVVVEYPADRFFHWSCYSTGRPEQGVIGYGMTKGRGAIWVCLPFIKDGAVAENGFGDGDATAEYALRVLAAIAERFGGEPGNAVLTGFSRGAMACWYVGLRNDRVASAWRGFHAVQGYDGGGWGGSTRADALERSMRIGNREFFLTDNFKEEPARMLGEAGVKTVSARSGLGAHGAAMFLDDRPSTVAVRDWFCRVTAAAGSPATEP